MPHVAQLECKWRGHFDDYVTAIAWSPSSQQVAACDGAGTVQYFNQCTQQTHCLQTGNGQSINALAYSHDGGFLAASGQNGNISIWEMGEEAPTLCACLNYPRIWVDQLAWNPRRSELAFSLGRYAQIWDAQTQGVITTLPFEASSVLALAWHPTFDWLAVGGYQGIKIWQHWEERPMLRKISGSSLCIAWSLDGLYLAAGNLDHTLLVWPWNQDVPWSMTGFPGKVRQLSWSGQSGNDVSPVLSVASGSLVITWKRQGDDWEAEILNGHTQTVNAIAYQPGSQLLASTAEDGDLYLWHDGQRVAAEQGIHGSVLAWSPDGQVLAVGSQKGEWQLWTKSA